MNYIALTIGPIYKTLANAKKPKELFSGSYLFSYIMKHIIKEFKSRNFIVPYIKDDSIFDENIKIGLFHDRFIFEAESEDYKLLKNKVVPKVLSSVASALNISYDDLNSYLQINIVQKELNRDENPILKLTPYLESAELFYQASQNSKKIIKDKNNFLSENKGIVDDLKELAHNNYYAIVHADGDKMGEVIKDKNNIENVSKNLFEYCKTSNSLIKSYGGQTIFAGGDDLLFIAPTVSKDKTKTIFELCDEISKDFDNRFKNKATLSFGVQVSYIKFPLYEALQNSRELLFTKAKNTQRNNIAFRVTKHSGQSFESIIHKTNKEVYDNFLIFTSNITQDKKGMDNFLHSIHHKIDANKTAISQIANDKNRLKNFFDNYFNNDIHKEYKEFFQQLIEFIYEVFQDKEIKEDEKLNTVYASLRFIKFMQGDKK